MKRFLLFALCLAASNLYAQVPVLLPKTIIPLPYANLEVCDRVAMKAYDSLSDVEIALLCFVEEDPVLSHFYSGNCSWYCGETIWLCNN